MATLGDLVTNLAVNTAPLRSGLATGGSMIGSFVSLVSSQLGGASRALASFLNPGNIPGFISRLGLIAMGIQAIHTAIGGLTMPLKLAATAEQTEIAFTTMLKSGEKAKKLIGELGKFSAATPFDKPEIIDAGRALLGVGLQAEHIIPTLTAIGDAASGSTTPLNEMVAIYAKIASKGKMSGEELQQFLEKGVPISIALAKVLGKPKEAIAQLASEGKISFANIQQAFANMSGKGGDYFNLMQSQSQSTMGLWNSMKDNLSDAMMSIGGSIIDGFNLKGLLEKTIEFIGQFQATWLPGIQATIQASAQSFVAFVNGLFVAWSTWIQQSRDSLLAWVDTFLGGWNQLTAFVGDTLTFWQELFTGGAILFSETWGKTFAETVGLLQFMIRNWYTLLQIAYQHVALFASNAWKSIGAFFQNFASWIAWLPGNWFKVMTTVGNLLATVFINMAKNVGGFFAALWDFASGKGFNFKATGLTEGFKSSIDELPEMVSAAVDQSTPELDRLYGKLTADELAFQQKQAARATAVVPKTPEPLGPIPKQKTLGDIITKNGDQGSTKKGNDKQELKAVSARTAEAYRAALAGTSGRQNSTEKLVSNTNKSNQLLTGIKASADNQVSAIKNLKQPQPAKLPS